ncbi:MAG TPA: calcium-binding protein [Allosphingosinicella sp.]|nr:calcium-binding protein [Allosphingosinicella sp.]
MAHIIGSNYADDLHGTNSGDTIEGRGGNDSLWGHGGDDLLIGGSGHDDLDGGSGADRMEGGSGDDYYFADSTGDQVVELADEGIDAVFTDLSTYTLGANVEDLIAVSSDDFHGIGNGLDNYIYGYRGDDILDGRAGNDVLFGHLGDDTFYVDDAGDEVVEYDHEGHDTIVTSLAALTLAANVEDLIFDGAGPFNGTGNGRDNYIEGGAGADRLDGREGNDLLNGGAGADHMTGGSGNDKFIVDNAGDVVVEGPGGGYDSVSTLVDYQLTPGSHIERLTSISWALTTPLKLTGNEFANLIEGNAGNNILDGRGGADRLVGFGGDDKYVVDNAGDVVVERAGGGNDSVSTLVDYTLAAGSHVERLTSISWTLTTPLKLTGNEFANLIEGNAGANTLDGKRGADTLVGFGGADTFAFTTALGGGNVDIIRDFSPVADTIALDDAVFAGLAPGALAAGAYRSGIAAQDADDRIIYNPATGALLFDADGIGSAAMVQFATLDPGLALSSADFVVI